MKQECPVTSIGAHQEQALPVASGHPSSSLPPKLLSTINEQVVFIFDARGQMQYCSAPRIFTAATDGLLGQHISQLLPAFPLRKSTPGYNLAYVRFAFADDCWQRHEIKTADGSLRQAKIHLQVVTLDRGHCLLGLVRMPDQRHVDERRAMRKPVPAGTQSRQNERRAPTLNALAA